MVVMVVAVVWKKYPHPRNTGEMSWDSFNTKLYWYASILEKLPRKQAGK